MSTQRYDNEEVVGKVRRPAKIKPLGFAVLFILGSIAVSLLLCALVTAMVVLYLVYERIGAYTLIPVIIIAALPLVKKINRFLRRYGFEVI